MIIQYSKSQSIFEPAAQYFDTSTNTTTSLFDCAYRRRADRVRSTRWHFTVLL